VNQSVELKIAHLEMVQGVISRLANSSSSMKSLSGTIVAAAIALYGTVVEANWPYLLGAALPVVVFWFLDARYLKIECAYRQLYDSIRKDQHADHLSMDYKPYYSATKKYFAILFSWSVGLFYIVLLMGIGIIAVSKGWGCCAAKAVGS
jgi:hypothetical protein